MANWYWRSRRLAVVRRVHLFVRIVWRRVDSCAPGRLDAVTAWEVAEGRPAPRPAGEE